MKRTIWLCLDTEQVKTRIRSALLDAPLSAWCGIATASGTLMDHLLNRSPPRTFAACQSSDCSNMLNWGPFLRRKANVTTSRAGHFFSALQYIYIYIYLELPAAEISATTHCGGNSRRIPENQPQTQKNAATKTKTPQHRLLSGNFRRIPADFRRIPADFRRKSGGRKN